MPDFVNANMNQLHEQDPSDTNAIGVWKIQAEEMIFIKNFTKADIISN